MVESIYGYCERCEAPVFLEVTLDPVAYKVHSYRCWNGHIGKLVVEHLSPMPRASEEDNVIYLSSYLTARHQTPRRRARR